MNTQTCTVITLDVPGGSEMVQLAFNDLATCPPPFVVVRETDGKLTVTLLGTFTLESFGEWMATHAPLAARLAEVVAG